MFQNKQKKRKFEQKKKKTKKKQKTKNKKKKKTKKKQKKIKKKQKTKKKMGIPGRPPRGILGNTVASGYESAHFFQVFSWLLFSPYLTC